MTTETSGHPDAESNEELVLQKTRIGQPVSLSGHGSSSKGSSLGKDLTSREASKVAQLSDKQVRPVSEGLIPAIHAIASCI